MSQTKDPTEPHETQSTREKPSRRRFLQSAAATVAVTAAPLARMRSNKRGDARRRASARCRPADAGASDDQRPSLRVATRSPHDAARRPARIRRPHRHEERLRPRPVRRVHGDRGRQAHQLVPDARRHARRRIDHDGRRTRRGDTLSPIQRAFIEHDAFQCGFCTPGQLCSATALIDEFRAGDASAVTAERARPSAATLRRRNPRAHERQHLPLWRVSEHRRGGVSRRVEQSVGDATWMRFPTNAPPDAAAAIRSASQPGVVFIGGGTNLLDLMKGGVARPREARRHHAYRRPGPDHAAARRRPAHRRARAQQRRRESRVGARALSAAVAGVSGGRVGATAQHGDGRRQPDAAHALLLLLRHRLSPVQQAQPRQRLRGARRQQPHPRDPRREPAMHRDESVGHERRARGARCRRARRRPARRAGDSVRGVSSPAGRPSRSRYDVAARRTDHVGRSAAAALRAALALPEGARPRELRVRAGLGRGGAADGRRHGEDGAHRARRRRAQAVARDRDRTDARPASRSRAPRCKAPRRLPCATRSRIARTGSRWNWRSGRSSAPSNRLEVSHERHRTTARPHRRRAQSNRPGALFRRQPRSRSSRTRCS